jgi:hypothetical protein
MNTVPNASSLLYASYHAYAALIRLKKRDEDVHDGCGEDEVAYNLYHNVCVAIEHFDAEYCDGGAWHGGIYDYEVWDVENDSAHLFYELLAMRSISEALFGDAKFKVGTVSEIVDGYAASNGWKRGAGGV